MAEELTLNLMGHSIVCSRSLLMEKSEYFQGMFNSGMMEANASKIELKETDPHVFEACVDFMKNDIIDFDRHNVHKVVEVACMYQIKKLISECSDYLIESITVENALSSMNIADIFGLNEVYNRARHYALWFFTQLKKTEEFLMLDIDYLIDIINDPQLHVKNELETFSGILSWILYDKLVRDKFVSQILFDTCLIQYAGESDLHKILEFEIIIQKQDIFSQIKRTIDAGHIQKRKRGNPCQFLCLHGRSELRPANTFKSSTQELKSYNIYTQKLQFHSSIPDTLKSSSSDAFKNLGSKVCIKGEKLYVCGGMRNYNRNSWLMQVWCYSSLENRWSVSADLTSPRRHHAMCMLGDSSFLIFGGIGHYRCKLSTVEEYNYVTGDWIKRNQMPDAMYKMEACLCNGHVYLVKEKIFCLNLHSDTWTSVLFSLNSRPISPFISENDPIVTAVGDTLYIAPTRGGDVICFNTDTLQTQTFKTKLQFEDFEDNIEEEDLTIDLGKIQSRIDVHDKLGFIIKSMNHLDDSLTEEQLAAFCANFLFYDMHSLPVFKDFR